MPEPISGNGSGAFTTKEMLVRIEGKVDSLTQTVAAKNAYYDVEIALLKARSEVLEREKRERVTKSEEVDDRIDSVITRQNVAAGAVAFLLFVSPLIWILVNKLVN